MVEESVEPLASSDFPRQLLLLITISCTDGFEVTWFIFYLFRSEAQATLSNGGMYKGSRQEVHGTLKGLDWNLCFR
jgi:hypothetical protein